jgi:hypothetical protein
MRVALAVLAAVLLTGCEKETMVYVPVPAEGTGALYGTVYTYRGLGADVTITTDPPTQTVMTGPDGTFRINGIPAPVVYEVTAANGYMVPDSQLVAISSGEAAGVSLFLASTDTMHVAHSRSVAAGTADIVVGDSIAYLATESAFEIRDLHEAMFGALIGRLPLYSAYARALARAGSYVYYCTFTADLAVIDISTPTAPVQAGTITVTQAHDAEVDGNTLVVAADDSLLFFSLANPAAPARIGGVATLQDGLGQGCYGVALDRTRKIAIVCSFNNGIEIVRYTDPANPQYLAQVGSNFNPWDADIEPFNPIAYIAGDNGVQVLDYTNPSNAEIVGEITPGGNGGRDVRVFNDRTLVFASTFNGLRSIEAGNHQAMAVADRLQLGSPSGVAAADRRAYVAAGNLLLAVDLPPIVVVPALRTGGTGLRGMRHPPSAITRSRAPRLASAALMSRSR